MTLNDFLIEIAQNPNSRMQSGESSKLHQQRGYFRRAQGMLLTGTDQEVMDEINREASEESTGGLRVTNVTTVSAPGTGNVQRSVEIGNVQSSME